MNHPLILRDAVADDAARLAEFGARTFYEAFAAENTAEDMRRHLDSAFSAERQLAQIEHPDVDTLLLADQSGGWAGFAQLRAGTIAAGVPRAAAVELWRFYVDKPWQGRGVADALMAAAKQRARRRGAHSLWLGVWERNARARVFYGRHGFRKVGTQVFVVGGDAQTDDVMLCVLS